MHDTAPGTPGRRQEGGKATWKREGEGRGLERARRGLQTVQRTTPDEKAETGAHRPVYTRPRFRRGGARSAAGMAYSIN